MRDLQGVWCLRNGEVRARGLKRDSKATFRFRTTPLDFCTACEVALEVRNGFVDPLGFRTAFETVLGVQNFSHALRKFRKVFEMI